MPKFPTKKTMLEVLDRTIWYRLWLLGKELLTKEEFKQIGEAMDLFKEAIEKLPDGTIS